MPIAFLDQIREIPDHRVPGMVTDPLDEILLSALVVFCVAAATGKPSSF